MHFNIYIDDETGAKLKELALKRKETRNALVRRAIQEWVVKSSVSAWPSVILEFQGVSDFPPFESHRKDMNPPNEDPFA